MGFPITIFVTIICFKCFSQAGNVFDRYKMATRGSQLLPKNEHLRPVLVHIYTDCPNQICENKKIVKYPEEYISRLLQEKTAVKKSFRNMLGSNVTTTVSEVIIGQRINSFDPRKHETRLCQSVTKLVKPLVMRNVNNQWRYIVNLESTSDDISQLFQIEICGQDRNCNRLDNGNAKCSQRHREVTFMVYEDNQFYFDTFLVPDVCMCTSSSCLIY